MYILYIYIYIYIYIFVLSSVIYAPIIHMRTYQLQVCHWSHIQKHEELHHRIRQSLTNETINYTYAMLLCISNIINLSNLFQSMYE